MLLLAKKPFPTDEVTWWVYLMDSSRLSGAISRTLVFFAPDTGERRIASWHTDAITLEEIPEAELQRAFQSADTF
jgi:hypothetical protein